jgi:hypothetical protein
MRKKNPKFTYLWPSLVLISLASLGVGILLWKTEPPHPGTWAAGWEKTTSLNLPRRALAAVANQTHVYAIGGIDDHGNYVLDTEFAPIADDGTLGVWQKTRAIKQGRFYIASVIVGQYLFLLGGGYGPIGGDNVPTARVERARINPDGSLSDWEPMPSMQLPRRGLKAVVANNRIYAVGGYSGIFLKSTEYATVNPDGSLTEWILDPEESNLDRYIHSASYLDGRIYLLGGHVQNSEIMSYGDVESSKISDSGALNPWEIQPSRLLEPRFIASSFALKNRLYVLGGHNGSQRLNSVEFAKVFSSGSVGAWSTASPLNTPRSAAATAVSGDYVYVLGGMGNTNALNSVEMATVSRTGQLGNLAKQ